VDGTVQRDWLYNLVQDPQHAGKRVLLLTHHDGFDIDPSNGRIATKTLYNDMLSAMQASGGATGAHDWWWYWGHVHAPIVYDRIGLGNNSSLSARCSGHGAIPYLPFPRESEELGDGTIQVRWAEGELANAGGDPKRALNGFTLITLSGISIVEEYYDENGRCRWSSVQVQP
jgi:hypothetical protein